MGFRDSEKARYARLKGRLFGPAARADGTYKGKPRPFCLADGHSSENLHASLRDRAIEYFAERNIPWHDGCPDALGRPRRLPSGHLCCSQSACVNALAPMMDAGALLAATFGPFLPEMAEPLPMTADPSPPDGSCPYLAFEWIGTRNYLGEVGSRCRGANATSADFAFRFRRHDGRVQLVLGEWKYTECYSAPLPPLGEINATRLRVYRDAFKRWRADQPGVPPYESFFADPFYQLMRLTLLAREMERAHKAGDGEMGAEIVSVVHVSPEANMAFAARFTAPSFAGLGRTVTAAWARVAPPDRFVAVPSERLLTAIGRASSGKHAQWAAWLLDRYGWWRTTEDGCNTGAA